MVPLCYCHFIIIVSNLVRYKFGLPNLFEWQNSRTKMNSWNEIKNNNQMTENRNNMKIYSTTILKKIIYQPKNQQMTKQPVFLAHSLFTALFFELVFFIYEINIYFDYDWHLVLSWPNMDDAKHKNKIRQVSWFWFL